MLKKMMMAAVAVFLFAAPVSAQENVTPIETLPSGVYKLDKTHASLIWRVKHLGLSNYTARFTDFDIDLVLDTQNIENSKLSAKINPASVRTDYPNSAEKDFDKKLSEDADWFNSKKFPTLEFVATKIERTGDNMGRITGNLTFLGVTKPVTLMARFNGGMAEHPFTKKPAVGFSATGTLNRSDWGMNTYIPMIGDSVGFHIEAEFLKDE